MRIFAINNYKMDRKKTGVEPQKLYTLTFPNGEVYHCRTMSAVYVLVQEYYPEFVRSRQKGFRVGAKNFGERKVLRTISGDKITLFIDKLYKVVATQETQNCTQ